MRQGFYKVAESYILYRAQRTLDREVTTQQVPDEQDSLIVVRKKNGESIFWDGSELKRRIQFAAIGLDLCLDENRIERELRRSIGTEITEEGLRSTIILNARALIERTPTLPSSPAASCSPTSTRKCSTGASCATASRC